jgi:serine/threonine-protein kinase RsbT
MPEEICVPIHAEHDIVTARRRGREVAESIGFSGTELTLIATAISELSRNIVRYAGQGEMLFWAEQAPGRPGLVVQARDKGPGIPDLALAMQDGYSTGRGLGLGLPGARRLMDEFDIQSELGKGTVVTLKKWKGKA